MAIYASDTQLYNCFERLFAVIENHDPQAANALLKASLAIRFDCVAPRASITIDARRAPVNVLYGPNDVRPTIQLPPVLAHARSGDPGRGHHLRAHQVISRQATFFESGEKKWPRVNSNAPSRT